MVNRWKDDRLEADVHSAICEYSPNSCVGELLYGCPTTAAVMASSLACVHSVHGRLAFTSVLRLTLHISRQSCFSRRNTLASGRRPGWWRSAYSHHYRLHYCRHRGLRACRNVSQLSDHTWAPLYTVCRLETSNKALYYRDSSAEPHDGDKYLEH